jgi:hypothetical protein
VPDGEPDEFVDRFARRFASFRREALVTIKSLVNERSAPPSEGELQESFATIHTPLLTEELGLDD